MQLRHLIPALLAVGVVAAVPSPPPHERALATRVATWHASRPRVTGDRPGRVAVTPPPASRPRLPARDASPPRVRRGDAEPRLSPAPATASRAATETPAATPAQPPAIGDVEAHDPTASGVRISWRTTTPARTLVSFGLDEPAIWLPPGEAAVEHEGLLDGLEPSTAYHAYLRAVDETGRSETATVDFTTAAMPPESTAHTEDGEIVVDGRAFFPAAVWRQCSDALGANVEDGINTFIGLGCGREDVELPRLLDGRAYSLVDRDDAGGPGRGLIGWYYPDEWDAALDGSVRREELQRTVARPHDGRIGFLTLTNHFYSRAEPLPQGKGMYPVLLSLPDVVGFDLYPLQGWCRPAFGDVLDAQRELDVRSGGKPTFQWIEAAAMEQLCGRERALDPTPSTVRAETWLAIAGGADGIGFFPNRWSAPIGAEIARTNRSIKALAAALAARDLAARSDTDSVRVAARALNGAVYVIAVNTAATTLQCRITVDGIAGRSAYVYGSGETVAAGDSGFGDTFGPLAARVYVIPPVGW